jgi:hypothetical protein
LLLAPLVVLSSMIVAQEQQRQFALETTAGLRLHNVTAEAATWQGKKGIRVAMSEVALREFQGKTAAEWTRIKIEVRGGQARLYVHDHPQPTLIVNDLKSGANAKGRLALWLDIGTVAHFRNLTVTRQ